MDAGNKRIVKNTVFLYVRMIFVLAVNLVAYRLVLQALGVSDYGIYQVVGGIVTLFALVNGALSAGSSRFITFALGQGDTGSLRRIFSCSFAIHFALALLVFVSLETVGLWYVNNHLVVPDGRMAAANWIFQFSIANSMLQLTQVPYSALIIAHERMDIYAFVGIAEALVSLLIVGSLFVFGNYDKLILYGALLCGWKIALQVYYRMFCHKHYAESHLSIVKDKSEYKKMLSFSLWDLIGTFTVSGNQQGVNLLINSFFGVIYNASFGLVSQLSGVLTQLTSNFMTAVAPQITKSYAEGNMGKLHSLVFNTSKMGFLLYVVIAVPVFFEADYILSLWLKEVPAMLPLFLRLVIIISVLRSFARPVVNAVHASGNIKQLNLVSGSVSVLMVIPSTWILYAVGFPIYTTFIVSIASSLICDFIELWCLRREYREFSIRRYTYDVYIPCYALLGLTIAIVACATWYLDDSFIRLVVVCLLSTAAITAFAYMFVLNKMQKEEIRRYAFGRISRLGRRVC